MSSPPKSSRFQFSLRAAIVAMILLAVAIGFYIRWSYYWAGKALDEGAAQHTPAELYPALRYALLHDEDFRRVAATSDNHIFVEWPQPGNKAENLLSWLRFHRPRLANETYCLITWGNRYDAWVVTIERKDGNWEATKVHHEIMPHM